MCSHTERHKCDQTHFVAGISDRWVSSKTEALDFQPHTQFVLPLFASSSSPLMWAEIVCRSCCTFLGGWGVRRALHSDVKKVEKKI